MAAVPNIFLAPGTGFVEDTFGGVWVGVVVSRVIEAHYIYCTLFLLLLSQLHLRFLQQIRFRKLGTPAEGGRKSKVSSSQT